MSIFLFYRFTGEPVGRLSMNGLGLQDGAALSPTPPFLINLSLVSVLVRIWVAHICSYG